MTTELVETQEEVHNAVVISGPSKAPIQFDITRLRITQMQEHAESLVIAGPDDKTGFKAVYDYRQIIAKQRYAVQNKQKELKRPHIDYNRDVDVAAEALVDPMKLIEDSLSRKEKVYNDERERIAKEAARAERIRIEGRVDQIRKSCFVYNVDNDTYAFGDVVVNMDDIRGLSDDEYAPTAELILTAQQAEADRLAEKKRQEEAERLRIANEQKKEREKIAAENKRLTQERADLQRKADELDALTLKNRITALVNVGWIQGDQNLSSQSGNSFLSPKSILAYTDLQFGNLIEETIADNKQREQERIDAQAKEQQRIKDEAKALRDKNTADKQRLARLKPDKKILQKFLKEAATPAVPATSEQESADFLYQYCVRLNELTHEFTAMLEVL